MKFSIYNYLKSLTNAGIPPLLKMDNKPALWCDKLCSAPAAHRVVSTSLVLDMALTKAATICGAFMMACLLASFLDSWCTIMAAWLTITYGKENIVLCDYFLWSRPLRHKKRKLLYCPKVEFMNIWVGQTIFCTFFLFKLLFFFKAPISTNWWKQYFLCFDL